MHPSAIRSIQCEPLRIVQITDTHIHAEGEDRLDWGHPRSLVCTELGLAGVLEQITCRERPADLVLATGDLAQDPVEAAYQRLRQALDTLEPPVYCLPGNHDNATLAAELLNSESVSCPKVVVRGEWLIVLLDSTAAGRDSGRLCPEELDLLDETLSRHPARHALICLHHHPVPMGSLWLDRSPNPSPS